LFEIQYHSPAKIQASFTDFFVLIRQ